MALTTKQETTLIQLMEEFGAAHCGKGVDLEAADAELHGFVWRLSESEYRRGYSEGTRDADGVADFVAEGNPDV